MLHAGNHAQHEHRRRAGDRVASTHLPAAGLQGIFGFRAARVRCPQYGEDAADGQVDVDIRSAVDGTEGQQTLPVRVLAAAVGAARVPPTPFRRRAHPILWHAGSVRSK